MKPQFIKTEGGEELVVISRREYDSLLARLGDEEAEDRMALRIAEEAERSVDGEGWLTGIPADMEHLGAPMVRANRERAGRSAADVAAAAGLTVPEYEAIERGERHPGAAVWRRLADALGIDPSWLPGAHPESLSTWAKV